MIYTLGHSNISEDNFCKLIQPLDVLLDIRSHPNSNKNPQFKIENLREYVPKKAKIKYEWEANLGGWDTRHEYLAEEMEVYGVDLAPYLKGYFPKGRINEEIDPKGKPIWYVRGFYDFQWYMTLPEFFDAAEDLMERGKKENVGIMCCECLWWGCHRSMVADYLLTRGVDSIHLLGIDKKGKNRDHHKHPTYHSKVIGNRLERYEPSIRKVWERPMSGRA